MNDPAPTAPGSNPRAPQPNETLPQTVPLAELAQPVPPDPTELVPGFPDCKELARGGMGVVFRARDRKLGRPVAIKTLIPGVALDAVSVARFESEARVTAQLLHPNVPPVYGTGAFADGRPFLVMKLIDGADLSRLLDKRAATPDELPRYVAAFEQVCRVVGYAHSRGVIHRDLKPSNVMIGAFGEVQVMDWGIAKVSGERDAPASAPAAPATASATATGRALGTPSYMAPEQANDARTVDARADVFALGGILAALLTGHPPFTGHTGYDVLFKAQSAELAEAYERLDACDAEGELVALAKRCLCATRDARPTDGNAVAQLVADYRAGIEARVRRAEADRAAAEARAEEEANTRREAEARAAAERTRRRAQFLLALAGALLVLAVAGFAWYFDHQRAVAKQQESELRAEQARREKAEAEERAARERDATAARAALKLAVELRGRRRFADAADALAQAEKLAAGARATDVLADVRRARTDTDLARDLDAIRADKYRWVSDPGGATGNFAFAEDPKAFGDRYAAALAARGFDARSGSADAVAKKVQASAVRGEIVRALDDWALTVIDADPAAAERVIEVARRASPGDETANRFRDFAVMHAKGPKAQPPLPLERDVNDYATSAPTVLLASALFARRADGTASGLVLSSGSAAFPNDFDIALAAALWYHARDPARAIGFNRAALALNPDHAAALTNLGLLLTNTGEVGTAVAVLERAVRVHPNDHIAHFNLGGAIHSRADRDDPEYARDMARALAAYERTIELSPNYGAAHSNLGSMYGNRNGPGDQRRALAALATAAKFAPDNATVRSNYGLALQRAKDYAGAMREYEEAIRLDRKYATGYWNIGALRELMRDIPGARQMMKRAAELDPGAYRAGFERFQKLHPEPK